MEVNLRQRAMCFPQITLINAELGTFFMYWRSLPQPSRSEARGLRQMKWALPFKQNRDPLSNDALNQESQSVCKRIAL